MPSNDGDGGDGGSSSAGSAHVSSSFAFAGLMQQPGREVMVDIGSGAAKPVFAAAALFPFARVVGIEVRPSGKFNVNGMNMD